MDTTRKGSKRTHATNHGRVGEDDDGAALEDRAEVEEVGLHLGHERLPNASERGGQG